MPYKLDGSREYRSFAVPMAPVQGPEKHPYMVEGYATTFDEPYEMYGGWSERISSSALAGADMSDVIFQLNHEGAPMARLSNDSMSLEINGHGLLVRAFLGGSQPGRDLFEAITNGLVTQMSWGFSIADDGVDEDYQTRTSTITRVKKVFDVSAVSIPANPGTEIHARSYLDGVIEAARRESSRRADVERRRRAAAALRIR